MKLVPPRPGRERVLKEATRLFAERGFGATSLQDVADAVGVTKQAVLHHFRSKEILFRAALGEIVEHWNRTVPEILLSASGSDDRFQRMFDALFSFFYEDPHRAKLIEREVLDHPDEVSRVSKEFVRTWLKAVAGYIDSGRERGVHQDDVDAEAYVALVLHIVVGVIANWNVLVQLLPNSSEARLRKELFRMTKASLFTARAETARASNPKERKRKAS